jgi:hypothetical protein
MYDADGNGWIDLLEMTGIVKSIYSMMGPEQVGKRAPTHKKPSGEQMTTDNTCQQIHFMPPRHP